MLALKKILNFLYVKKKSLILKIGRKNITSVVPPKLNDFSFHSFLFKGRTPVNSAPKLLSINKFTRLSPIPALSKKLNLYTLLLHCLYNILLYMVIIIVSNIIVNIKVLSTTYIELQKKSYALIFMYYLKD